MNVVGHSTKPSVTVKEELPSATDVSKTILLYDEPPLVEMSLDQFEIYALKRLKILRKLERAMSSRTNPTSSVHKKSDDLRKLMKEEFENSPEIDIISHFILRAAYSLDEEKRRWFLNHEAQLFRIKLEGCSPKEMTKSCKLFQLTPLSAKEQQEKSQLLRMLLPHDNNSISSNRDLTFYKVPFTQALDLVKRRQCIVERGFAYIPATKVVSILVGKFRMHLSAALAHLAQNGIFRETQASEAERLHPLLKNMNSCMVESEPSEEIGAFQSSKVTPANIPKLVQHMPLCMRNMQNGLKRDKKLRYQGRLQYPLFLKGAGLTLEQALQYFQRSFSNMTPEQFQKEYAYNIRHLYGKEGQKKSKKPYNCGGIINSPAPSHPQDHHGCPYKNLDSDKLSKMLQSLKIGSPADRTAIVNLQKSKHYNLACLEHFKVMHPDIETKKDINLDNVGNHPNAWFRASMAYHHEDSEGDEIKDVAVVAKETGAAVAEDANMTA